MYKNKQQSPYLPPPNKKPSSLAYTEDCTHARMHKHTQYAIVIGQHTNMHKHTSVSS